MKLKHIMKKDQPIVIESKTFKRKMPLEAGDCIMVGPDDRDNSYGGPLVYINSNNDGALKGWARSTDDDDT